MSQVAPQEPNDVKASPVASAVTDSKDVVSLLSPGLNAVLDMNPGDSGSVRFNGTIVGWIENQYIAWQMKVNPKTPWRIVHDEESVLRFLADGRACAVNTVVTDWYVRGSQRIVYMSWPSRMRLQLVRQDPRAELEAQCTITMKSGSQIKGTLLQLSLSGCRIHAPGCTSGDTPTSLTFRLPNGFPIESLPCESRHTFAGDDALVFGCKTEGEKLTPVAKSAIDFFVTMSMSFSKSDTNSTARALLLGGLSTDEADLAEWFRSQQLTLITTESVIELFARLQTTGAAVVLLDADLQDPTAIEIARILQQSEGFRDTRIVFYGGDEASAQSDAEELGATFLPALDPKSSDLLNIVKSFGIDDQAETDDTITSDSDA